VACARDCAHGFLHRALEPPPAGHRRNRMRRDGKRETVLLTSLGAWLRASGLAFYTAGSLGSALQQMLAH